MGVVVCIRDWWVASPAPPTRGCQIGTMGTVGIQHKAIVIDMGVVAACISAAGWV